VGVLRGTLRTEGAGEERIAPLFTPFFLIPSGVWRKHEAVIDHHAFPAPEAADGLGYAIFLRRDETAVHVRVAFRGTLGRLA